MGFVSRKSLAVRLYFSLFNRYFLLYPKTKRCSLFSDYRPCYTRQLMNILIDVYVEAEIEKINRKLHDQIYNFH